jgi:uncharacterized protein YggE
MRWIVKLGILVTVMLRLAATAAAQDVTTMAAPSNAPVIVTMGEADVQRAPDRAWVTIAAESRARTPEEAQRANATAMTAVTAKVRAAGVPSDAIQTVGYNLQPEFDFANGRQSLRDYLARNEIHVRVDARPRPAPPAPHVSIDRILRIEEQREFAVPQPRPIAMMARQSADVGTPVPVEAGQIDIRARVVLTVGIK